MVISRNAVEDCRDGLDVFPVCVYQVWMRSSSRKATAKPLPKGMKIQLKGLIPAKDVRAILHEAADKIEALGIPYVRGVNLYFTPADEDGNILTRLGRQKLSDIKIVIEGKYRSAADEYDA